MKYLFFLLIFFSTQLIAQNLITNGSFDQDISGWDTTYADVTWVADDGHSANGSFEIKTDFNNGGISNSSYTPIEVNSSRMYRLSVSMKVMPDTLAAGAAAIITWLNEDQMSVGYTEFLLSDDTVDDGVWHRVSLEVMPPDGMKYAQIALGVDTEISDSDELSVARFDDVRFEIASPNEFAILPSHSGSWYDPAQSGHGLNVEILPGGRAQVYWYTYDHLGNTMWLVAVGTHDGVKFEGEAAVTDGASFPPMFNSSDVMVSSWGYFELHFTSCNKGVFKWRPNNTSQYTAGEMVVSRLTMLAGMVCNESTE